jgi:hypothetical protein
MPGSARDRAAAGDRAAELNEQVAQGHEFAAHGKPRGGGDLHSDAAAAHREVAGEDRSDAEAARDEEDGQTDKAPPAAVS